MPGRLLPCFLLFLPWLNKKRPLFLEGALDKHNRTYLAGLLTVFQDEGDSHVDLVG